MDRAQPLRGLRPAQGAAVGQAAAARSTAETTAPATTEADTTDTTEAAATTEPDDTSDPEPDDTTATEPDDSSDPEPEEPTGDLSPGDVEVQVVHGRVRGEDNLVDTTSEALGLGESYEGGRHRFDGHVRLARAGSFGYTVRILPKHGALASPAELGLVALA